MYKIKTTRYLDCITLKLDFMNKIDIYESFKFYMYKGQIGRIKLLEI